MDFSRFLLRFFFHFSLPQVDKCELYFHISANLLASVLSHYPMAIGNRVPYRIFICFKDAFFPLVSSQRSLCTHVHQTSWNCKCDNFREFVWTDCLCARSESATELIFTTHWLFILQGNQSCSLPPRIVWMVCCRSVNVSVNYEPCLEQTYLIRLKYCG